MHRTCASLLLLLAAVSVADAAPCALVDKDQATWAVKHLTAAPHIVTWCEACGDKTPGPPTAPQAVKTVANKIGWQVLVEGKVVDLAHVFVQTGPRTYANVGRLVGCTAGTAVIDVPPPSTSVAPCPPAPPRGACPKGTPTAVRDAITGCVRDYLCPP